MKNILIVILFLFVSNYSFSQIAIQSFEETAVDTWGATFTPVPCTNGSDRWDYSTSLSAITPSVGLQFWGVQDLNGNCGPAGFGTIALPDVDVSTCTGVSFSFDFYSIGYDTDDDIKYELFYDNVSQGEVLVVDGGTLNSSTGGWETETVIVPDVVNTVRVIISVRQNGGSDYSGIDNILLNGTCVNCIGVVAEPTNEVTGESVTNISCSGGDINWTNGVGSNNALIVMSTSAIAGNPVDGVNYAANSTFGSGETIAAGEFVVYNGVGGVVSVDGLLSGTTYFVKIFEYNGTVNDCEENYLTGGVTTSFSTTGPVAEPTNEVTGEVISNIACTTADLDWINGAGSVNTLVVVSTSAISGSPVDGTAYAANANFGSGSTIAAGEFVVFNGSGSSVSITGLAEGGTYFVTLFEYNGKTQSVEEK